MSDPFRDSKLKSLKELLAAGKTGGKRWDLRGLAQILTILDLVGPRVLECPELLNPERFAFRIGITGPPGAGKSTLIKSLITELRARKLSVAILAVDPSSPFSKGAILGDRIRFNSFEKDENVFIRSIGSRGSLGGLSASAYLILRAFDHFGFDIAIVETVGVGQTELEIMNVADCTTVVLVPESGDGIQAMKAGLLEIADLFVVNKADRPGADSLARELEQSIHMGESDRVIPVLKTNALKSVGVTKLVELLLSMNDVEKIRTLRKSADRLRSEAIALLRWQWEQEFIASADHVKSASDLLKLVLKKN